MKMKPEHYAVLKDAFVAVLAAEFERLKADPTQPQNFAELVEWQKGSYPEYTERRLTFDFFWWVNRKSPEVQAMMPKFYQYANDDHLFTALKAIIKELKA